MVDYNDPPDMPDDERMTDAEFRVVREFLGLTGDWLAAHLKVNPRTVRSWEQGRAPIPDGVRLRMEELEATTAATIGKAVKQLLDVSNPGVAVYRTDAEYHAAHPTVGYPASWHRAVVARVAQEVPGLSIVYADQNPTTTPQGTSRPGGVEKP
ncbi:DUF1870 family protein [Streptomyces sp. NPDC005953]|uniref:helix-turn-helix domain-containing protein n=1 Tax=Streptomyces sp. NPDC005953 TaxID=3156719 RepID=UPI0033FB8889